MPYYNKVKKKWIAQVIYLGDKHQAIFDKKKDTTNWEVKKKADLKKGVILPTATISLHELAVRYLDHSKSKFTRITYLEKRLAFVHLLKALNPQIPVAEIHQGDILEHLRVQAKKRSGNSANKDRKIWLQPGTGGSDI